MSMFKKICPQCSDAAPVEATHCACGYSFSEIENSFSKLTDEMIAEEEALYEEYLAARAAQAEDQAEQVKNLSSNSTLLQQDNVVDESELNARIAKAQLKAQSERVAVATKKAADAKAERKKKALDKAKRKAEKAKARAKAKEKAKKKEMAKAKKKVEAAIKAEEKARAKAMAKAEAEAIAQARAEARAKEEKAKAQARAEAKADSEAKAANNKPTVTNPVKSAREALIAAKRIKETLHKKASGMFQAKQAEKAEQIMQQKHERKVELKPIAEKEVPMDDSIEVVAISAAPPPPDDSFRLTQAARAEQIRNTKECPNCTAQLEKNVESCKCGYKFEDGASLMPSISLDMADVNDTKATISDVKISTRRVGG